MTALKRPEIWGKGPNVTQGQVNDQSDNNQEKGITAKRLSDKDTKSSGDQDTNILDDKDVLPQNVKESSILSDKPLEILSDQEIIHQTSHDTNRLDAKTPKSQRAQTSKSQKAQQLDDQASKNLDAVPLGVQTLNQLAVEPLDANPSDLQVDETLKQLSDDATNPLDVKSPKKKKAKSVTLVKKTYYIDHELDGAIELMAVLQKSDQSDIIRKLLRSAIPEYYLTQWKAMSDHSK